MDDNKQEEIESNAPPARAHVVIDKHTHVGDVLFRRFQAVRESEVDTAKRVLADALPAFVVDHVLSQMECDTLIQGIHKENMEYEFWNPDEPNKKDLRNVCTVEVQEEKLAGVLWDRLKDHVVTKVVIEEDDDRFESGMQGTWEAYGINPVLLFANYGPGNHFSPHSDGNNVVDFNHRSLFSVLVYLNTCEEGGGTLIFKEKHDFIMDDHGRARYPPEAMTDKALAKCGSVLAFSQELMHEGEPVGPTSRKIIIRTDVMYRRNPPLCDEPADREAFKHFQEASLLEGQKKFVEAGNSYRKCCRLSETLARHLNIYGAF